MDLETARYIVNHFSHLLNPEEKLANKHLSSLIKLGSTSETSSLTKSYRKIGWLTEDKDALELVALGEDGFKLKVAERILKEHENKVFMNYCPNCKKLARTPAARQCRYCGLDWHS